MAKIPRLNSGDRPSAVPNGALPSVSGAGAPFEALGNLADVGGKIIAVEEARRQKALEGVQAIANEVAAGRIEENFGVELHSISEDMKAAQADNPEQAINDFRAHADAAVDRIVKNAPNSAVGLMVARAANSRKSAELNKLFTWAQTRTVQMAEIGMGESLNTAMNAAGVVPSPVALEQYIDETEARLSSRMDQVYSPQEAEARKKEFRAGAVAAYSNTRMRQDPVGFQAALKSGAFDKYIDPDKREAFYKKSELALENRGETRRYELLVEATGDTRTAVEMLSAGKLDPEYLLALQRKNREAARAASHDPSYTPEQRAQQVAQLEHQGEILDAIVDIDLAGRKFDPAEQIDGDSAALADVNKTLKKLNGQKDLQLLSEQQDRLILKRRKKEITAAGFSTMMETLNRSMTKAGATEAGDTGWWIFQSARQAGNEELNTLFKQDAKNATPAQRLDAQMEYTRRYLQATKDANVDKETALRFAREAVEDRTGIRVGGRK